jgi:hypothetical protein
MYTTAKLGAAALVVALMLSAAGGTASARSLSVNKEDIRAAWNSFEIEIGIGKIRCQVTMEGSFHRRTIPKVVGTLIGVMTRAVFKTETCVNARTTVGGLPWHLTYEGFAGNLPNITSILILLSEYLLTFGRVFSTATECSYGTASDRLIYTAAVSSGTMTNIIPAAGNRSNLLERRNEELFFRCPSTIEFVNGSATEGQITLLSSTNRVSVTLI